MPDALAWALFLAALMVAILGAKQLDDRDRHLFGGARPRRRRRTTGTGRLGEDNPSTLPPPGAERPRSSHPPPRSGAERPSERPRNAEDTEPER